MRILGIKSLSIGAVSILAFISSIALAGGADKVLTTEENEQTTSVTAVEPVKIDGVVGSWWLNGGVGANTQFPTKNLATDFSINYAVTEHQLLTVRTAGDLFKSDFLYNKAGYATRYDAGILYGLMKKSKMGYVSASAGLGAIGNTGTSILDHADFGIPFEVQAFLTPTQHFGVGIIGFADANVHDFGKSFGGAALAIQVGQLWS